MIQNGEKWVTSLEMSRYLIEKMHLEQQQNRSRLQTQVPSNLRTLEHQLRVVWSPGQAPSPSKALRELSSGDSSPCDDECGQKQEFIGQKLSIKDVSASIVNTLSYEIRILEPSKTEKYEKIPLEWQNQRELILFNYDVQSEICNNKHSLKKYFKEKFKEWPFVIFEDIFRVSIAGENGYTIKLKDDRSAKFFYFNLYKNSQKHKRYLGDNFQLGVLKQFKEIGIDSKVIMRFLPLYFTREKVESIISRLDLRTLKIEELFEYEGCKYGVIYCQNIAQAEQIVEILNRYFYDRKQSQPEICSFREDGKRISQQFKQRYCQFFQSEEQNTNNKFINNLCNDMGIKSIDHCRNYVQQIQQQYSPRRPRRLSSSSSKKYYEKKHNNNRQKSRTHSQSKRKSGWETRKQK